MGKVSTARRALRYAPLVIPAVQKYGPQVWEQLKSQREPAERYMQTKMARGNQRKKARAHAETVRQGSVLRVFHRNESHWVVFSADKPIAVHPPTSATFAELLEDADLDKKVCADERRHGLRRRRSQQPTRGETGAPEETGTPEETGAPEETGTPEETGSSETVIAPGPLGEETPGRTLAAGLPEEDQRPTA